MKMKNKLLSLLVSLSLILTLAVPAFAETDYGYIYDETEQLGSDLMQILGRHTLPALEDAYGISAHVDILTDLADFEDVTAAAQYLFDEYDYGYGDNQDGISLTLLAKEDKGSYIIEDWVLVTNGIMDEAIDDIHSEVSVMLTDEVWSGDLEQDAQVLAAAAGVINEGVVNFMEGSLPEAPTATEKTEEKSESETAPEAEAESKSEPAAVAADAEFIFDDADILTDEEEAELESKIAESAAEYGCGVYFVSVKDFNHYAGTIEDAAGVLYDEYGMGIGEDHSGVLLLLSMDNRKYDLKVRGYGQTAFTIYGRNQLNDVFLDDFKEDDWYSGVSDYVDFSFEMIEMARDGHPLDENTNTTTSRVAGVIACVVLAFLTAFLITSILKGQLKSAAKGTEASEYQTGGVNLKDTRDMYTHTTTTRVYVEPKKDNDNYSDTSNSSSDTSGSF